MYLQMVYFEKNLQEIKYAAQGDDSVNKVFAVQT